MKILLLEDNETLANGILDELLLHGYVIDLFHDGEEGLYALNTSKYDLLILDLGLPSIDGIDIIKKLRNSKVNIPILIISARDRLDQRILGLDSGADDYLCKPFDVTEIIARVQALYRRNKYHLSNKISYNDLVFDTQNRTLYKENILIDLNKRELAIFEYLVTNIDIVLSKQNIVEHITSFDNDDFNPTAIETYISRLRKRLSTSVNIKTVRGLGYILSTK